MSEAGVRAAGDEFRRRLGLLAAEDMEGWLEREGITLAEWWGWVRDTLDVDVDVDGAAPAPPPPPALDPAFLRRRPPHGEFPHVPCTVPDACGAAALTAVCRFHGAAVTLTTVRDLLPGRATLAELARAGRDLGFHARTVKASKRNLDRLPLPAIVHVDEGHWAIVHGLDGDRVLVSDPARGPLALSRADFEARWSGYAALLAPRYGPPMPGDAGFSDVDASGQPARLAEYLRAVSRTDFSRERKAVALAALGLRSGSRALDIGCGLGEEVRAMAALVGASGRAVGLDASDAFVTQARAEAAASGSAAEFVVGDAHALPFADGEFDAVRTERTLQHIDDPAGAVAEMARVTAPGGVVTASEPDWDTLVIDVEPLDVTRRVQAEFCETVRNPTIGRSLRRLLAGAGLTDVAVEPATITFTDARLASHLLDLPALADRLLARGDVAAPDADRWLEAMAAAQATDTFFAAATGFFASARKPA